MYQELVHEEEQDGFNIKLYLIPEDYAPDWDMSEEEKEKLFSDIDSGHLLWFCAKVAASKEGIELASDYLGGCCYESVQDFVSGDRYYRDMKRTVIDEARKVIQDLTY